MFIQTGTLRKILKIADCHISKTGKRFPLYYYPASQIISSLKISNLNKEFKVDFRDKLWGKQDIGLKVDREIIIRPVLNGFILVDIEKEIIYKFVNNQLEPNFLSNEKVAAGLLSDAVPKLAGLGEDRDLVYIVQQYINHKNWIKFDSWESMLKEVQKPLNLLHKNQHRKIKKIGSKKYVANLVRDSRVAALRYVQMRRNFEDNIELYCKIFSEYYLSGDCFQAFQHGDITPNNVIKTKKKIYLFDFQNGGELNIFYDLMIQDFYSQNNYLWKNFNRLNLLNVNDTRVLKGWIVDYNKMLKNVHQIRISDNLIKTSIIISLLEISLKNFLRYQSKDGLEDGLIIQNIVRKIGLNILKS